MKVNLTIKLGSSTGESTGTNTTPDCFFLNMFITLNPDNPNQLKTGATTTTQYKTCFCLLPYILEMKATLNSLNNKYIMCKVL